MYLYLFQMLIKSDLIKINYSGVRSVFDCGQNVHLISSLQLESLNYYMYIVEYG